MTDLLQLSAKSPIRSSKLANSFFLRFGPRCFCVSHPRGSLDFAGRRRPPSASVLLPHQIQRRRDSVWRLLGRALHLRQPWQRRRPHRRRLGTGGMINQDESKAMISLVLLVYLYELFLSATEFTILWRTVCVSICLSVCLSVPGQTSHVDNS